VFIEEVRVNTFNLRIVEVGKAGVEIEWHDWDGIGNEARFSLAKEFRAAFDIRLEVCLLN